MIKRISHIVLSTWLAILLLFGGTSKEFIHLFSGHEDTVHSHKANDGIVIEPEHHHCSFLQFSLTSFINDVQVPFIPATCITHISQYNDVFVYSVYASNAVVTFLRGPPLV